MPNLGTQVSWSVSLVSKNVEETVDWPDPTASCQISEMAHEKGYCVATSKNVIDFVTPCVSTHSKSRPDLVLYHTKHYHAYVIKSIEDEDCQDEDQVVKVTAHCFSRQFLATRLYT